ncbi:MAG: alpha amylase C-terminal domain-containing protein [Candidatus Entotheonellia bacterium]
MATTRDHIDRKTPMRTNLFDGGVRFRVWAPSAQQVFVLTGASLSAAQQPGFVPAASETLFSLGDGTWGAFVPGLGEEAPYRFWVVGTGGSGLKRDPRARELGTQPGYPNCDCLVRAPDTFPWHDQGFRSPEFRDLILYQLHIGVYYATDALGRDKRRSVGKFLDLLDRVEYLHNLGINGVQPLPIQEFPSETSRGYNGLDLFSPEMDFQIEDAAELTRYLANANALLAARGQAPLTREQLQPGPNQLKCVIDLLHLYGIAVLFDLVFNHAGPGFNEQSLWFFDRQPFGDDNRSLYFTDHEWVGGRIFAYWKQDVRQFLIDNAVACLQEYHIDGIRYDEVSVIDNNSGGRFSQDLSSTVRFVKPQAIQIAEYWNSDRAAAVKPVPSGLGFDVAWGDRLRDGVRAATAQASGGRNAFVDLGALGGALDTPAGFQAAWRVVNCLENHDIVYEGRERRLASLADSSDARSWYARSRARVATGILLVARGIPMLFMGQEFLEDKPWSDDVNFHAHLLLWWDGLQTDAAMRDHLRFCQDLLWLRRLQPALRSESLRVSTASSLDRVLAIHRWIEREGRDLLCVANLQEFNRFQYRIGFPTAGGWREVFNSDYYEHFPNPAVTGNGGGILADGVGWDGMPASAEITIPANGFLVFARP